MACSAQLSIKRRGGVRIIVDETSLNVGETTL